MKKLGILVLIGALHASLAQADDTLPEPYLGLGLGAFELNDGNGNKYVFGGFAKGGVHIVENAAVELRLGGTSNVDRPDFFVTTTPTFKADWFVSYLLKPQFEAADRFRLYGLIGATTLRASYTGAKGAKFKKTNTDFSFGIGGEYEIVDELWIGVEWMRYSSSKDKVSIDTINRTNAGQFQGLDVNGFTATLTYEF